jgi:hypothetical protein
MKNGTECLYEGQREGSEERDWACLTPIVVRWEFQSNVWEVKQIHAHTAYDGIWKEWEGLWSV